MLNCSIHRNPVPQRYRSEHSTRMRQLSHVTGRFRPFFPSQIMASDHVAVTFGISLGDVFNSFAAVQTAIRKIEERTAVQLYRRDCKTLAASVARYPGRAGKAKPELKYYLLAYCCVFGGKIHKTRSTGDNNHKVRIYALIILIYSKI